MIIKNGFRSIICISLVTLLIACGGAEERKMKYLEKGKNYFSEKNYEKAEIEFKNVMQIDPKMAEAYYYMGQIQEKKENISKAVGLYNKAIDLDPDSINAKIRVARIYSMIGTAEFVEKAETLIKEVYQKDSGNDEAAIVDATINIKKNNQDKAQKLLAGVMEHTHKLPSAYSIMAAIYTAKDDEQKAVSVLKDGIKYNPDNIELRVILAQHLSANVKDMDGAEGQLKEVIKIRPDWYGYRTLLAKFYSSTDQLDKAEDVLRTAIKDKPDDIQRYVALVEFLSRVRSVKVAEGELKKQIADNPELFKLKIVLADFYKKINAQDKAITVLNEVIQEKDNDPEGIKAKIELADIYILRREYSKVKSLVSEVLEEFPNDNDALLVKAKLAYMEHDDVTVVNALRSVLKNEPGNSQAALLLAQAHDRSNDSELARDTLEKILEVDPTNPVNHLNYANYLASKNELKDAEETVDKALGHFNKNIGLLTLKLKLLAARNDRKAIALLLDKMKKTYPTNPSVLMMSGKYNASLKQYDKALDDFEAAFNHTSARLEPLEAIVKLHLVMGNEDKAFERLNDILKNNPDDPIANQLVGQLYAGKKNKEKAQQAFQRAMKQGVWDKPFISAATLYLADKNYQKALDIYKKGEKTVNSPIQLKLNMASIYEAQKDYDTAINIYEEVLKLDPEQKIAINNLASLLVDIKNDQDSKKRAMDLAGKLANSQYPAFQDTLGWVHLKNSDFPKAVEILKKVVEKAPHVAIFQYHLGMAYKGAGDITNAKRYLAMAVESDQDFQGKEEASTILDSL